LIVEVAGHKTNLHLGCCFVPIIGDWGRWRYRSCLVWRFGLLRTMWISIGGL